MMVRSLALSQILGGIFAGISLFAVQWMNLPQGAWLVPTAAALSATTLVVARQKGDAATALLSRGLRVLPPSPGLGSLLAVILLGIALRVLVAIAFPANLVSDSHQYLDLAHKLAAGDQYSDPGGLAFWPPGLPLALAPLLLVFGRNGVLLYSLMTFGMAAIITFVLGSMLANRHVGLLSAFLIAIWPNFVLAAPILLKECLSVLLWPVAIYLYLRASEAVPETRASVFALLAGVSIGYAALTQPSDALLGGCFALFSLVTTGWQRRTAICLLFAAFGAAAVVTPWTIRNYVVLHGFVPIATEGGTNFFMVTQLSSDGRWSANYETPEAVSQLTSDELERNRRGFILGIKSIAEHPAHFLGTVVRKPFYIFGQDMKSSYFIFERGGVGTNMQYAVAYWISGGFYLVIVLLITVFVMRKNYVSDTSPALVLPWMFVLYPIFSHSLFEAAERHHYGALSIMAIFAAMAAGTLGCPTQLEGRSLSRRQPALGPDVASAAPQI
jgi:hypothetical protein